MRRTASTMQSSTNLTRTMPSQKAGSTNPMVAYLNMSLHEDGAVVVQASPSVRNCIDQHFKQQFIGAHESHIASSSKSGSKRQKTSQGRASARAQVHDDDDAPKYPYPSASSFSSQPDGCITLSFNGTNDDNSDCEGTPRPIRQDRSFFIKETDKVTEFLRDQLRNMQQNAVKRLAKAWIKGICPKKQAKFPYHDAAKIPDWWPSQDLCPFKEPDHIRKDHRLNLCMHILRLRPKKGELQAWNEDPRMPAGPYDAGGWTQFLKAAAPIECIKDLREPEELNELRIGFLAELYKLADKEEEYLRSGIDATDRYLPMEAPQERSFEIRRLARLRIAKEAASKKTVPAKRRHKDTGLSSSSKSSSSSDTIKADPGVDKPKKKRARRNTGPSEQTESKPQTKSARADIDTCAMSPYAGPMSAGTTMSTPSWPHRLPPVRTHSSEGIETSFASTTASFCAPTDSFMADSNMIPMSTRPVHFQTDIPMTFPTYSVTSIPQPSFRTVPNSPITPHISLYGYDTDHQAAIAANSQAHPWTMNSSFGPASFTSTVYDGATSSTHAQPSMMTRTSSDPVYQQSSWGGFAHAPQVSSADMCMPLSQPERPAAAYGQY